MVNQEFFSVAQTARLMGVGYKRVNRMVKDGSLKKTGGVISRVSIEAVLGHPIGQPPILQPDKKEPEFVSTKTCNDVKQAGSKYADNSLDRWKTRLDT